MQNKKSREKTQTKHTLKGNGKSAQKIKERFTYFEVKNANKWA